jgi:hypothetical protein
MIKIFFTSFLISSLFSFSIDIESEKKSPLIIDEINVDDTVINDIDFDRNIISTSDFSLEKSKVDLSKIDDLLFDLSKDTNEK